MSPPKFWWCGLTGFPGAHEIGAATSSPRIAGKKCYGLELPGPAWELRFWPSFPSFRRQKRSSENLWENAWRSPRHPSSDTSDKPKGKMERKPAEEEPPKRHDHGKKNKKALRIHSTGIENERDRKRDRPMDRERGGERRGGIYIKRERET